MGREARERRGQRLQGRRGRGERRTEKEWDDVERDESLRIGEGKERSEMEGKKEGREKDGKGVE